MIDEALKQWATDRQIVIIDAINKFNSHRAAAKELSISHGTISNAVKSLKYKASLHGYSPQHDMTRTVPDNYIVKGVSTYYNKDGKPSGQWVKSKLDESRAEIAMLEAIEAVKDDIPRAIPRMHDSLGLDHLLNCYVITDYHLGMLSWREETGADWDLKIAEDMIIKWFAQAIHQSPQANQCVFAQSKHLLDVDTRFAKLVRVAIRVLRQIIDMLLAKHQQVHVIMADANHDPVSQIWLREWFAVFYENEPRITVDRNPSPYNAYEFGNVGLFFHHGHKRKVENVSEVFAALYREMFGRTKYAYAHMGHMHHLHVKENPLMIVEQHRTLAANDAYAARGGWISGRDAKCISYHKQYGEVSRLTVNSDMLKA